MTTPSGLTMDAGALIAVERGQRRLRVLLDETERARLPIVVPVGPLAQVWRDGARASTLAFNLDGTLLAAASSLGDSGPTTVSLIDVADRREVSRLEVPQRGPIPPTQYFTAIISPVALALRPGGEVLCQQ